MSIFVLCRVLFCFVRFFFSVDGSEGDTPGLHYSFIHQTNNEEKVRLRTKRIYYFTFTIV